ncbi:VENN motif pre-toxin domain-containing protein [Neisseria weaveri]|uniref:VENN motif pre-toxin domain-containing protein n=1 Tax=Neisseria weaveri TaxID=28091 RepID=UPI00155E5EE0|nr:VENN motif pre-toxin domain-containing protein [Neisseria weaveri]
MSYHIGQHFKQNDELNQLDGGKRPGEGSKEHIALHTLNGLLTGAANGSHAVVSGLSAGGAELLVPTLAQSLYGKSPKELTAEEKANIGSLAGVFGAAVGAASGDVAGAVVGSQVAQSAVENNYLTEELRKTPQSISTFDKEMQACKARGGDCSEIIKKFLAHSNQNRAYLIKECTGGGITCPSYQEIIAANTGESYLASIKDPDVRRIVATVNAADLIFLDKEIGIWSKVGNAVADPTVIATLVGSRGRSGAVDLKSIAKSSTLSAGNGMLYNFAVQWAEKRSIDYRDLIASGIVGGITGAATPNVSVTHAKKPGQGTFDRGSSLPVSKPVKVAFPDGSVTYQSNPKHTPGGAGWNSRAGREPQDSLRLFQNSQPIPSSTTVRFARDQEGNIHRFSKDPNNQWHWNGGTGDKNNPLILDNKVKAELRNLGWKGKILK